MNKYRLTNKAVDDLTVIWHYTKENWSENQADKYYKSLTSVFQGIADNPEIGKNYPTIMNGLLGLKKERHIIFYRMISKSSIEIIRILHERMDLKDRSNNF